MNLCSILTALFVITCTNTFTLVENAPSPPTPQVSFYKVAFQWPYALCYIKPCRPGAFMPARFLMHGVWPADASGVSIERCSGASSLQPGDLTGQPLRSNLLYYWPSYILPDDVFWQHEWNTHGTCSGLTPHDYFTTGVNLCYTFHQQISDALAAASIYPGPLQNFFYPPMAYHYAIVAYLRYTPQIRCEQNNGNFYLVEIRLCFNLQFQQQNCPTQGSLSNCGSYQDKWRTAVYFYV